MTRTKVQKVTFSNKKQEWNKNYYNVILNVELKTYETKHNKNIEIISKVKFETKFKFWVLEACTWLSWKCAKYGGTCANMAVYVQKVAKLCKTMCKTGGMGRYISLCIIYIFAPKFEGFDC